MACHRVTFTFTFTFTFMLKSLKNRTCVLRNSYDQEGNKLQRQKILGFVCPVYNHNWRNISTIYMYITRLALNEIFSPSNKMHREVGRAKDLSAPL